MNGPRRRRYDLAAAGLEALARGCPDLRSLTVANAPGVDADGLEPLIESSRRLEELALAACPKVADKLLERIGELAEDQHVPLKTLKLAGTACTATGVADLRDELAGRSTRVSVELGGAIFGAVLCGGKDSKRVGPPKADTTAAEAFYKKLAEREERTGGGGG